MKSIPDVVKRIRPDRNRFGPACCPLCDVTCRATVTFERARRRGLVHGYGLR